jgi:two-component system, response regulator YesN
LDLLSILLVDDEASVVDTLEATIPWNDLGISTIYKAYDGEEALDILYKHPIDIVLTDIQMPKMNGIELIKQVSENWKKTKCILLSGYADFTFAKEAIKSHALEYLLKPISDDELIQSIAKVSEEIKQEWELAGSYLKATYTLKENLPLLRGTLLQELLQGRKYKQSALSDKLQMLELPFINGDSTALILIRLEEQYSGYTQGGNFGLLDFSIRNIFEELVERNFQVWACKDVHDYMVFLVKQRIPSDSTDSPDPLRKESMLTEAAAKLQDNVSVYLKSSISIIMSRWGVFPEQLSGLYQTAVSEMRKRISGNCEFFITAADQPEKVMIHTLQTPYEPPILLHLLEAGRWDTAEQKINDIFDELLHKNLNSMEHLMEVYFIIAGAFTHIAHKNGALLEDFMSIHNISLPSDSPHLHSMKHLHNWSLEVLLAVRTSIDMELRTSRSNVIKQVQQYIDTHLSDDVSLRAVADAVYLHPNYLSTLYKAETSESLSDYIYRLRMEKATYYLKHTKQKIYEVALAVGYQSPHYFIKVFKKHFGKTPQEYRDQNQ